MSKNQKSAAKAPETAGRLDDQLCFALYAATNAITRIYRPLLTDLGLTYPQFLVMVVLWEHRSRRLGEIASDLDLATHAISPIIDRLEEAGLVTRIKDETDGRVVHVELTKAGARMEPSGAAVQEEVRCRTTLPASEVTALRSVLKDLLAAMNEE